MTPCTPYQSQLLEYVYDVLEPAERAALESHLAGCPACQSALAQARRQQEVIGMAAKKEFAGVRFVAPTEPAKIPLKPQRPARPAVSARSSWRGYAMAASILLAFSGAIGLLYKYGVDYLDAKEQIEGNHRSLLAAVADRKEISDTLNRLPDVRRQETLELAQKINEQQINVRVTGPKTFQPGAPNAYKVETFSRSTGQPLGCDLSVKVVDDRQNIVFEEKQKAANGVSQITLPPNLSQSAKGLLALKVEARRDGEVKAESSLSAQLELTTPVYMTHLATDKPMYKPGEIVRFRSLTLDRATLKPAEDDFHLAYAVKAPDGQEKVLLDGLSRLADDKGKLLLGPDKKFLKGLGAGEWEIPENAPGGEYILIVREAAKRFPEQIRKFIVNKYERSRLNKELNFSKKSYGAGEEIMAACSAKRAEGASGPAKPIQAVASLNVDGKIYGVDGKENSPGFVGVTDSHGKIAVRFKLPAEIDRGEASLTVIFNDGDGPESLVRPVPLVTKKLALDFFPEGGDLVAGVSNRVYFQARTLLGKPADLKAHLVDAAGKTIAADIQTLNDPEHPGVNQGQGVFTFTPEMGKKYELKIDSPLGIITRHELPETKDDGIALTVPTGVTPGNEPFHIRIASAKETRKLLVGVYCRGRLLDHQMMEARAGKETEITLNPNVPAGGVCRVTIFEDRVTDGQNHTLVPRAERLVYRTPSERVDIKVTNDKKQYAPGDKANLTFQATNENGVPTPAVLMVAVVDKNVLALADEKTAKTMATQFYLGSEVRKPEDLEYADFLLTDHPKAKTALDLLLGTQGWRRFAEQNPVQFRSRNPEEADRLLVSIGQETPRIVNLNQESFWKLEEKFQVRQEQLQENLIQAEDRYESVQKEKEALAPVASKLVRYQHLLDQARSSLPVVGAGCLGFSLIVLLIAVARKVRILVPLGAVAGLTGALILAVGLWGFMERRVVNGPLDSTDEVAMDQKSEMGDLTGDKFGFKGAEKLGRPEAFEDRAEGLDKAKALGGANQPADPRFAAPGGPGMPNLQFGAGLKGGGALQGGIGGLQGGGGPGKPGGAPGIPLGGAAAGRGAGGFPGRDKMDRPLREPKDDKKAAPDQNVNLQKERKLHVNGNAQAGLGEKMPELRRNREGDGKGQAKAEGAFKDVAKDKEQPRHALPPGNRPLDAREMAAKRLAQGRIQKRDLDLGLEQAQERLKEIPPAGKGVRGGLRRGGRDITPEELELAREPSKAPLLPFIAREYAHERIHGVETSMRTDFAETLYWAPVLVLPDGKAAAGFELGDSITTFQVLAFAHTPDGRLGAVKSDVVCKLPFVVEPKIPIEVTSSDTIAIPVSLANNSTDPRAVKVSISATGLKALGKTEDQLTLDADGRARRVYRFQPTVVDGSADVQVVGSSEKLGADSIVRTFKVVPEGFPVSGSISEVLEGSATNTVNLPETWLKGTLKCQVHVYPSTLADLQSGLEALLREPNGCFEQTSTTNYPNLLILNYLKESDQTKPEIEARARDLLARGYERLTSFECLDPSRNQRRGYEWFGGTAPAHEALTAYGLLEFRDMAKVYAVDAKMLERTKDYLVSRKDGKGGFQRNPQALDSFGRAPDDITNAYIVWALTESGKEDDVAKELETLIDQADHSEDPYFLALVANSLVNRGRLEEAAGMLKKLISAQKEDGHLDAQRTSITGSGGRDLQIETTGLAVLAWLKANKPDYNPHVQKAIKWISQQRGGYGGFGSTQSTILALKALIAYAKANKKTAEAGELRLMAGNETVSKLDFPAGAQEALVLDAPEPEKVLKAGPNKLRVEVTGKNNFPYTLSWSYQTLTPPSADKVPVKLETKLDKSKADEGDSVRLTVRVENATGKGQGMAVAIIGLPSGLSLPENLEQLKRYTLVPTGGGRPVVSYFEIRGRELILYWRDLAPDQKIEVPLDLSCRVPGEYRGPASRAYLYYNADVKCWAKPLEIAINAKE